ncbi:hypothetical protein [Nocardia crassostreae]|uniref:hypothetical protein n=1 Tax=Nocardia crassostreae TaxID=53428 RepID=UPI00082E1B35|nr:hypothetical protein [Nocardia crassostreae]
MPVFGPRGIAIAANGDVYVAEYGHMQKPPAGGYTPERVSITGLEHPYGIAVDSQGGLYATDYGNGRILKMSAGVVDPVVLTFADIGDRDPNDSSISISAGVAVDRSGTVFVTDPESSRVLKLPSGSDTAIELLTVDGLGAAIAVSSAGELAVISHGSPSRILTLPVGATTPFITVVPESLSFGALAFDLDGNLLLADNTWLDLPADADNVSDYDGRLWKLVKGATEPVRLPYTDLGEITGIAVDPTGSVVVIDGDGGRVLRLLPAP